MDEFTSAFLSRDKGELKDIENDISFTPFGKETDDGHLETNMDHKNSIAEPESVKQWQREFSAGIQIRDAAEAKKDQELKEKASKELTEWATWYKNSIIKSRQGNRAHEEELQALRDRTTLLSESVSKVNPSDPAIWERISQLCDFSGKQTSTYSSGDNSAFPRLTTDTSTTKDVARFRSMLLSLKHSPPKVCQ